MNLTEKMYYNDPYQSEFSATVIGCERYGDSWHIALDRTCFYPEGGGQPGDLGFLSDVRVLDCRVGPQGIIHVAENMINLGETVIGKVDFLRRFTFMQNHTGEHIVSGIVKELHGFDNVGFHLSSGSMTMDFNGELLDNLAYIEELANNAVYENVAVEANFIDSAKLQTLDMDYRSKKEIEGSVRLVRVPRYDLCACTGLHVTTTGEIGAIKIVSGQRYKGGCRLYAVCGHDALADYQQKNESVLRISKLLSVKPSEVSAAVEKALATIGEQKKLVSNLKSENFALKAQAFEKGTTLACAIESGLESDDIRHFASKIAGRAKVAFVFSNTTDSPYSYKYAVCSMSASVNITKIANSMNSALNGRGSSKDDTAQGVVYASRNDIETYLTSIRKEFELV